MKTRLAPQAICSVRGLQVILNKRGIIPERKVRRRAAGEESLLACGGAIYDDEKADLSYPFDIS